MKKSLILLLVALVAFACVSCNPECEHEFSVTTVATCTAKGVETCKLCGITRETAIDPENHVGFETTAASTCAVKGTETCACGATRELALDPANHAGYTVAIDATCCAKGAEVCGCGKDIRETEIDPSNHGGYTVTTAATCIAKGVETCGCGNNTRDIEIDPTNHNFIGGECTRCEINEMDYEHANKVYNKTKDAEYDTLAAAFAAAANGDEIILCKNETVTAALALKVGITLDLNGHTIENTGSKVNTISVRHASSGTNIITSTLTIKNGTIKGKPNGNGGGVLSFINVNNVVLEDLVIVSNKTDSATTSAAAVYMNAVKDGQIKNCTVTGKIIAYQKKDGVATVNVTFTGGTFVKDPGVAETAIIRLSGDAGSNPGFVTVNGSQFEGTIEKAGTYPTFVVNSGTWNQDVSDYVPATSEITQSGDVWVITVKEI